MSDLGLPDLPRTQFTQFTAHCMSISTDPRTGNLVIKLGVPMADKYSAMPLSDHPGESMHFTVERVDYETWAEDDIGALGPEHERDM